MSQNSKQSALATFDHIEEMLDNLQSAREKGDNSDQEEAVREIHESPLEVRVRSGWEQPDEYHESNPKEFEILMATGGPAVKITGQLDANGHPTNANLKHQDWHEEWQRVDLSPTNLDKLIDFASHFYFQAH